MPNLSIFACRGNCATANALRDENSRLWALLQSTKTIVREVVHPAPAATTADHIELTEAPKVQTVDDPPRFAPERRPPFHRSSDEFIYYPERNEEDEA